MTRRDTSWGEVRNATEWAGLGAGVRDTVPNIDLPLQAASLLGVAASVAVKNDGALSFVITDHLGSTTAMTNEGGVLVSRLRYTAFGERREAGEDGTPGAKYRYTSQMQASYHRFAGGLSAIHPGLQR